MSTIAPVHSEVCSPTERWKDKSANSPGINRVHLVATAVITAIGVAATTVGIVLLCTASIIGGIAVTALGFSAATLGAIAFAVIFFDQSWRYNNPDDAAHIVQTLREDGIEQLVQVARLGSVQDFATYGIIPIEHVEPINNMVKRYSAIQAYEAERCRYFQYALTLGAQNIIVEKKNAINTEWLNYRTATKLAEQLPDL